MNKLFNSKHNGSDRVLKSIAHKKVSSILVFVLIATLLLPALAFASTGFNNDADFSGTTVTGSVYSDTYNNGTFTVSVYSPYGTLFGTVNAVYSSVYNNVYKFNYTVSNVTYSWVKLAVEDGVTGTVYQSVYKTPANNSGGGGAYGGGGASSDTTIDVTDGTISESQLISALAKSDKVTINLKNTDFVALPASALATAKDGAVLVIVGQNGTYELPISVLKLNDLAKALGVDLKDLKINVSIKKLEGSDATAVTNSAKSVGTLLSDAVDFSITAEGKNGKKISVDSFGNVYVKRHIPVKSAPSATATAALYDKATGKLSFVPSTVSDKEAVFQRTGNSVYVVIDAAAQSFNDVKGHWAQANIELLAKKLIVEGTGANTFEPERNINRAEFAALVVRSLGLSVSSVVYNTYFKDVNSNDWYAGVVVAAKNAGLIDGFEDGTFQPNKQITREQLTALIVRALNFAGVKTDVTASEQASLLAKYTDADSIVWAQKEVAAAIKAGIVNGVTDTTLASGKNATRAESSTILKRLLTNAGFIK